MCFSPSCGLPHSPSDEGIRGKGKRPAAAHHSLKMQAGRAGGRVGQDQEDYWTRSAAETVAPTLGEAGAVLGLGRR